MAKLKLGLYWAASCGGCEIAVLEIGDRILTLLEHADVVFWPCVADFKYKDVQAYDDGYMDVCLFNGAIRNSEGEEVAQLLRKKSKVLVAFGSCATKGCIPALANLYGRQELLDRAYLECESVDNPQKIFPQTETAVAEGKLHLPEFYTTVRTLADVVPVDYFLPGCPPVADRIWDVVLAIVGGNLPSAGSVVGVGDKAVCDECKREKRQVKITKFHRPHEIIPEPDWCLLEQGILCMGPATRSGCGALCLNADMPCRGCYGPTANEEDQGAAMMGAIGSIIDAKDDDAAKAIIDGLPDPAGYFYRFGMSKSTLLRRKLRNNGKREVKIEVLK
ncbi:MAG: oxidoreductase [bacterium]|jgi:F420-non-reducing hydrogenase small subunit